MKTALSIPLSVMLLLALAAPVAEAPTPMRAVATVVAPPTALASLALAPLRLNDTEMARVEGGWITWVSVTCIFAGAAVTAGTGNPGIGIFAGLVCNDLLSPKPLY